MHDAPPAPRVGLVVVSHSASLASAAIALAAQMAGESPAPVAAAAGTADGGLGTDATAVAQALADVAAALPAGAEGAGIVVLMDLGSAVLSAELALELVGELPVPVRLCPAPLVEGLVAATVLAGAGAGVDEVAAEAVAAGRIKAEALGTQSPQPQSPAEAGPPQAVTEVVLVNAHGLHARPAAALVAASRRFDAAVRLAVAGSDRGADARSISAVSALGAGEGAAVRISATGPDAGEAVTALAALVRSGFGEPPSPPPPPPPPSKSTTLPGQAPDTPGIIDVDHGVRGVPASPGRAIGPVWHVGDDLPPLPESPAGPPEADAAALRRALEVAAAGIREAAARAAAGPGASGAGIFEAHALLLDDDDLTGRAADAIAAGSPAARAWHGAVEEIAARLDALADPYQRGRAADVRDVGRRVLRALTGAATALVPRPGVLIAEDVTPDDVLRLDPTVVDAVLTAAGSPTSHAAILARSVGLPLVVGAGRAVLDLPPGTTVAVDGGTGEVLVDPGSDDQEAWRAAIAAERAASAARRARAAEPAFTADGVRVAVECNARSADDAAAGTVEGAEGVGLLRTEFLFLDRSLPPTEHEQEVAYRAVARAAAGHRVTIRTLDVGGDKPLPYVEQPLEANPFLGLRGLRLALARPDILDPQLRAIVRVAADHPVAVMVPMVTTVAEVVAARRALDRAVAAVDLASPPPGLDFGIMVEVPAAALRARHLAPLVDFVSIGTNDLTQYALAAERGNGAVGHLGDALDPAVLRLIDEVCRGVSPHGVRVAVCGELAAEPGAAAVLIGLGVRELSVSPPAVARVKDAVRAVSLDDARRLAAEVLDLPDAAAVRRVLAA